MHGNNGSNGLWIELRNVSKEFPSHSGPVKVLNDIDLSIREGELLAVVGKSGSGKSTLLNLITGIDRPTGGSIRIHGTQLERLDEAGLAEWRGKNIGIVFQFFQLIPTLTVLENVLLAMEFVGVIPEKSRLERARSLLNGVGIAQHAKKLPSSLSGGEQQRAAIARALANDPAVLVADEPTGNLDSRNAEAVQRIFIELAGSGKTVIVVTHEKTLSAGFPRVITLQDGALIADRRN